MFIRLLIQSLISFLLIDSVWITLVASPLMRKTVPHLLSPSPNFVAAGLFYLIYLSTLIYLILTPAITTRVPLVTLATQSFLFGFAAYATYDLTNLAILRGYPWSLALADMIWGGTLTMIVSLIVARLNS